MKKIDSRAFWVGSESKTKINDYLLRGFLTEEGFDQMHEVVINEKYDLSLFMFSV